MERNNPSHFTEGETEAQECKGLCQRLHFHYTKQPALIPLLSFQHILLSGICPRLVVLRASAGGDYAPTPARGQLAMSGDIFGCHDSGGV